jgi:hypothetical protein
MLVGHPSTPRINNRNAYSPTPPTRPHLRRCRRRQHDDLRSRGTASPETRVPRSLCALLVTRTAESRALDNRYAGRTNDTHISCELLRSGVVSARPIITSIRSSEGSPGEVNQEGVLQPQLSIGEGRRFDPGRPLQKCLSTRCFSGKSSPFRTGVTLTQRDFQTETR